MRAVGGGNERPAAAPSDQRAIPIRTWRALMAVELERASGRVRSTVLSISQFGQRGTPSFAPDPGGGAALQWLAPAVPPPPIFMKDFDCAQ